MKWCCEKFKFQYEERYDRTIFVFCTPPEHVLDQKHANFWLGMRSVEHKDLKNILAKEITLSNEIPGDVAQTLRTSFPIWYCPWCGKKLVRFYGKNPVDLYDDVITEEFAIKPTQTP